MEVEKPSSLRAAPIPIGGYVLAGGRSSRMGREKALLKLAGKPLIRHAVDKLRCICADVRILGNNPALADFAPLVPDLRPNAGPLGGIEAALAHSNFDWNLILPVDVPFLPGDFLCEWASSILAEESTGVRIAFFTVNGIPQPTVLLIHRAAAPYIAQAIERGNLKLLAVLEAAGRELAARSGLSSEILLRNAVFEAPFPWFANLNTPDDMVRAEAMSDAAAALNH